MIKIAAVLVSLSKNYRRYILKTERFGVTLYPKNGGSL